VADALVHGYAGRGYQAGHGSYDPVVARRNHVGARAQDGDKLEHIVIVRRENRGAWNPRCNFAAGNRVKPLHRDENREHAMALNKCLRRFRKTGNVMLIFAVDLRTGFEEISGAVLAALIGTGKSARDVFSDGSLN